MLVALIRNKETNEIVNYQFLKDIEMIANYNRITTNYHAELITDPDMLKIISIKHGAEKLRQECYRIIDHMEDARKDIDCLMSNISDFVKDIQKEVKTLKEQTNEN